MPVRDLPTIRVPAQSRLPKGPRGGVELLLVHNVEHLGKQGEVVEVKRGFAYNYLLPAGSGDRRHRAPQANGGEASREARGDRPRAAGRPSQPAGGTRRTSVTIEANANDEGHLYGSVGAPEISRSLKQQDLMVGSRPDRSAGSAQGGGPLHREGPARRRSGRRSQGLGGAVQRRRRREVAPESPLAMQGRAADSYQGGFIEGG
jgi:large subunit ribosomal protein L9